MKLTKDDIYQCDEYEHLAIIFDNFEKIKQQIIKNQEGIQGLARLLV